MYRRDKLGSVYLFYKIKFWKYAFDITISMYIMIQYMYIYKIIRISLCENI